MNYIEGSMLLDYNDIVESDHWACIIDVDIEEYFKDKFSRWDNINCVMLNPVRRSYRETFKEVIED